MDDFLKTKNEETYKSIVKNIPDDLNLVILKDDKYFEKVYENKKYSFTFNDIYVDVYRYKDKFDYDAESGNEAFNAIRWYVGSSSLASLIIPESSFMNTKSYLFEKVGLLKRPKSKQMILGNIMEPYLQTLLSCYDTTSSDDMVALNNTYENIKNGLVVNDIRKEQHSYIVVIKDDEKDEGYPVRVSPDFILTENNKEFPVDTKFVSRYSFKEKELTLAPSQYTWQSIMQQLVYDSDKGYLFYLIGNEDLKLVSINIDNYLAFLPTIYAELKTFYSLMLNAKKFTFEEFYSIAYPEQTIKLSDTNYIMVLSDEQKNEILNKVSSLRAVGDMDDEAKCVEYIKHQSMKKDNETIMEEIKEHYRGKYPNYNEIELSNFIIRLKPRFGIKVKTSSIGDQED